MESWSTLPVGIDYWLSRLMQKQVVGTCIYYVHVFIWETEIVPNWNDWPCWMEYMTQKKWSTIVTLFLLWELLGALESEVIGSPKKKFSCVKGNNCLRVVKFPHIWQECMNSVFNAGIMNANVPKGKTFEVLWATVHLCVPMAGTINTIN
jgi:hypothetical protein